VDVNIMKSELSQRASSAHGRRGNTIIELTLMAPWLFFLFAGVFDFGFYAYALISVENAARVAALSTSVNTATANNQTQACQIVLKELGSLPNGAALPAACDALPLIVTAQLVSQTSSLDAAECSGGCQPASLVQVTYRTIPLIPIPGLLASQLTFTRPVEARVKGN
jgi:Flp pilus assembly protein TadG